MKEILKWKAGKFVPFISFFKEQKWIFKKDVLVERILVDITNIKKLSLQGLISGFSLLSDDIFLPIFKNIRQKFDIEESYKKMDDLELYWLMKSWVIPYYYKRWFLDTETTKEYFSSTDLNDWYYITKDWSILLKDN